ncbi:hypothetical protein [Hyphococcus sp.]|uniref:hypothetical protein n=1 Tax=Hyphococcus sp. TaxID=2038636 RepID=UPI003CCBFE87
MKRLGLLSIIFYVVTTPVTACSLIEGVFLQSNFEMIDSADAIVVGKAVRKTKAEFGDKIVFKVTAALKGNPTATVFDQSGHFGKPIPSDPNDISSANREAFMGSCVRGTYRHGDSYVLMLRKNDKNEFAVSGDAFSRMNEDNFGPGSLWRKTIETYLEIQKNPDRMVQLDEMRALALRGMSEGAAEFEQKIGEDAMRHLLTIHPDKPTQWLIAVYNDPDFAYRSFEDVNIGTEEEEVDTFVSLLYDRPRAREDVKSVAARALSEGDHPEADPIFRQIIAQISPPPTELGASLAFFVKRKEYALVKQAFGKHILWVEGVTGPGAGPGFWSPVSRAIGYGEYRIVPTEFGDWWDRQSFASCLIKNSPTNCNYDALDINEILANPTANETLLIASAEKDVVQAWAISEVDRLKASGVSPRDRQWNLPVKLLLAVYRGEKPKQVLDLACGSKEERERIAIIIGKVRTYGTANLLHEMMAMQQHEHVRGELFNSAAKFAEVERSFSRTSEVGRAFEYARSDDILPLDKYDDKHLPCY